MNVFHCPLLAELTSMVSAFVVISFERVPAMSVVPRYINMSLPFFAISINIYHYYSCFVVNDIPAYADWNITISFVVLDDIVWCKYSPIVVQIYFQYLTWFCLK